MEQPTPRAFSIAYLSEDDLQHALLEVELETSRKLCKSMRLPPNFGDFCADDRGNVVDFYDRTGQIAILDREAEHDGKTDQTVFSAYIESPEFEAWLTECSWAVEIAEVPRI